MIDWLNNLHPTVNALIVVLGSTTALLTLAAALRSCWRACRKLFRRQPVDPNRVERNKRVLERTKPRFREKPDYTKASAGVIRLADSVEEAVEELISTGAVMTSGKITYAPSASRQLEVGVGILQPERAGKVMMEGTKAPPPKVAPCPRTMLQHVWDERTQRCVDCGVALDETLELARSNPYKGDPAFIAAYENSPPIRSHKEMTWLQKMAQARAKDKLESQRIRKQALCPHKIMPGSFSLINPTTRICSRCKWRMP